MENNDIEMNIADTIMERPYAFSVNERQFSLYPVTLGKTYLLLRLIESLGMNADIIKANPYMEALRLCREKKDIVCRLLAYHTLDRMEELFDSEIVDERCRYLSENLSDEEMSQLLVMVLAKDNTEEFIKFFGIDKDREELAKISKIKNKNGNSVTFGGKSVYGTLIDYACERYGWTMEYVVWGISYANLIMLKADAVTSVYLTDEERKEARIKTGRTFINADDPANAAIIKALNFD